MNGSHSPDQSIKRLGQNPNPSFLIPPPYPLTRPHPQREREDSVPFPGACRRPAPGAGGRGPGHRAGSQRPGARTRTGSRRPGVRAGTGTRRPGGRAWRWRPRARARADGQPRDRGQQPTPRRERADGGLHPRRQPAAGSRRVALSHGLGPRRRPGLAPWAQAAAPWPEASCAASAVRDLADLFVHLQDRGGSALCMYSFVCSCDF